MKRIASFLATIALVFTVKLYFKSSNHDDIKKMYLASCETASCTEIVTQKFDECFESNYNISGRSKHFNQKSFDNCLIN